MNLNVALKKGFLKHLGISVKNEQVSLWVPTTGTQEDYSCHCWAVAQFNLTFSIYAYLFGAS